jgi:hypothetical protein
VDIEDPEEAARRIVTSPEAIALLAADAQGRMVFRAAELQRRAAGLEVLRKVVDDTTATEHALQRALEGQHRIFGGRFVGEAAHRRLVSGDEVDIPLIRGDRALHAVELKRAASLGGPLMKKYRGSWCPPRRYTTPLVRRLTTWPDWMKTVTDCARNSALKLAGQLIGHPSIQPSVPEDSIDVALRTLNTHVNRVEVLTYKGLVDNAERSLGGPSSAWSPHSERTHLSRG